MISNNSGKNSEISDKPEKGKQVEEHGLGNVLTIDKSDLLETAKNLKEAGFNLFLFVSGIDYPDVFKLTYRIVSVDGGQIKSVFVKTQVPKKNPVIDSLTSIWPNASWHERETYDLFGVEFKGHSDLRRIFMPDDWEGHPLRKDYSDDHMIVFPEFLKDREKQGEKAAAGTEKEKGKENGQDE
jgi:NADH/F420H2 dehydrogenase subunit C